MGFVDDLKSYLLPLRDSPRVEGPANKAASFEPDLAWSRKKSIEIFERLEKEGPSRPKQSYESQYREWTSADRDLRFTRKMKELLAQGFLQDAPPSEVEGHISIAMARYLGLKDALSSAARTLELDRLAKEASSATYEPDGRRHDDPWRQPGSYALEIRATRRTHRETLLTPIGKVFIELTGRDAIQWLLSVEVAQSTGPADDWRLSRETAAALLAAPRRAYDWNEWTGPHSWRTLRRLEAMGLLHTWEQAEAEKLGYDLFESGMQALKDLLAPSGTPFSVLTATLSQDEALSAVGRSGAVAQPAATASAAAATARQARMFAHEIRNALTPAQFALQQIYTEITGPSAEAAFARYRPRIDGGIDRIFRFVERLLTLSELGTQPPESFNVMPALRDAVVEISGAIPIELPNPEPKLPPIVGYRDRFVLAIVNILRNAAQAGSKALWIHGQLVGADNLELIFDDDGPGVPAEHRQAIFKEGFALRPGGSGQGLSLVREVVESELQGRISCETSPKGGARFIMRIPVKGRTTP